MELPPPGGRANLAAGVRRGEVMSKQTQRILRFLLIAVVGVAACGATALAQTWNSRGGEAVTTVMRRDPAVMRNYGACPADVFRQARASGVQTLATCAAEPMGCWTLCSKSRDGNACFRLALAFQQFAPEGDPRSQILFTMACARGMAAGCTNRGAGIRNSDYDGDPLKKLSKAKREACTARSFAIACRQEDSWGCFMLGQATANGEGVQRDLASARADYARACAATGGQDVAGCAAANEALKDLDRRR
jgi:hypothetical protein